MWRCIDMRNHACLFNTNDLEKMAMEAVDRSGGHMEEFYAEGFASDGLLRYIADRSTGLRCITLISPFYVLDNELAEKLILGRSPLPKELQIISCSIYFSKTTADNMPSLHELQLIGNYITNEGLMAILDKCRLLKSVDMSSCYYVTLDARLPDD